MSLSREEYARGWEKVDRRSKKTTRGATSRPSPPLSAPARSREVVSRAARGAVVPSTGDRRPLQRRRRPSGSSAGRRWRPACGRARSTRWSARSSCSGPGRPLRVLIEADRLSSVILWGPPGTGKTTIARLVAGATSKAFEPLSAVTRRGEGRARGRRAGPRPPGRAGPGHDPLPRRGAPLQPHPAGRAAPARGGGPARPHRRDHREPVLLAHRPAARRARRCSGSSRSTPTTCASLLRRALDDAERGLGDEHLDDRRRRARPPRRPRRGRRPPRAHQRSRSPRRSPPKPVADAITLADAEAALGAAGAPLRRRRALRRALGVHQEHPRVRRRRRSLLAGAHARGGGGRPASSPAGS